MVRELGEIKIIELFRKYFETQPHIFMGVGNPTGIHEDAGAIRLEEKKLLVVTTDLIGKKTHVPPSMTLRQMGRKAVIVNISDLAAMGAEPLGLVFSVGFPNDIKVEQIEAIARGMNEAAKAYNTCIFGGDTNKTDDIILAGTAIGLTDEDHILLRSGAHENDIIAVTGWIGDAALGLYCLKNHLQIDSEVLQSTLEPKARLTEALALNKLEAITAAGDITDGLALELYKIGEASKKGMIIEEKKLPIQKSVKETAQTHGLNPIDLALYIGEDFELLLTIKPDKWHLVQKTCAELNLQITQIGKVTAEKKIVMESIDGKIIELQKKGYDQFKNNF
ncbi:MAG: thiamine-phosphate kinase [Candidatus Helarchaeota archaeon]